MPFLQETSETAGSKFGNNQPDYRQGAASLALLLISGVMEDRITKEAVGRPAPAVIQEELH